MILNRTNRQEKDSKTIMVQPNMTECEGNQNS